jgi:hypothetical protein
MAGKLGGLRRGAANCTAGLAVTVGLAVGASGVAVADPSLVPTPVPKPTVALEGGAAAAGATATATASAATGGDVLDQLAEEYAVGAGGGQLSNLLRMSLKLRAMGFKPSKPYLEEITTAMKYRPNQGPLISALKNTIAYQQKIRAQTQVLQQAQSRQGANSAVMGAGQMPGDGNPGAAAVPVAPAPAAPAAPAPLPATP